MRELKPCPFCGGEADAVRSPVVGICAVVCNCASHVFYGAEADMGKTIAAWNTRAERTCHIVPHGYCIANGEESSCRCWSCSECSYGWHVSDYDRQYRYCPNCGARVIEE